MTSKTSFFNKAIYKSTVKRCIWGAVLYAVLLFLSSGFAVIVGAESYQGMKSPDYYRLFPMILDGGFMIFPCLLAIAVPTVVALITFRFLHSKRQSVFIHSMPVSRRSNFISTILASFTLMFVPVVLNTLFLIMLSVFGYGYYFTVTDCLIWALYSIYPLFIMFSCAVFAACITGNGYGMVGINILVHSFLLIIASNIGSVARYFLYGYTGSNAVTDALSSKNFVAQAINVDARYHLGSEQLFEMLLYSLVAAVIYFIAYAMYKRRKIDSVGNVAGFNCLNAVFKYALCLMAALISFVIFSSLIEISILAFVVILVIFTLITYLACEMLFKKTTKVLYSWKGYVSFAVLFTAMIIFFANSSFFGYETRVPDEAKIAKAGIVGSVHPVVGDYFSDDAELIELITDVHKELVKEIPEDMFGLYNSDYPIEYLSIDYELKDGSYMRRRYQLAKEKYDKLMGDLDSKAAYINYKGNSKNIK